MEVNELLLIQKIGHYKKAIRISNSNSLLHFRAMTNLSLLAVKLLHLPGVGHRTAYHILTLAKEYNAFVDDKLLAEMAAEKMAHHVADADMLSYFEKAAELYRTSLLKKAKFTSIFDSDYPKKLTRLRYPPVVLNYFGEISFCNDFVTVTLSGTRHPTSHGYAVSMRLGELFALRKCVVVAGLAAGCGTAAHRGCLKANGRTVAVVGHGLAHIYPRENAPLAEKIIEAGGAIVSTRFLNEAPRAEFFVERNLVQGGLCDFMVITQTRPKSGIRHIMNAAKHCGSHVYIYDPPAKFNGPAFAENKSLIHCNVGMPIASQADIDRCLEEYQ